MCYTNPSPNITIEALGLANRSREPPSSHLLIILSGRIGDLITASEVGSSVVAGAVLRCELAELLHGLWVHDRVQREGIERKDGSRQCVAIG